jgi:very-short-patch-repair endonuclease
MATTGRPRTASNGQLSDEFRSRDQSGILVARRAQLLLLITDVGVPCWAFDHTAGALHGFDGFRLRKQFELVTERGHNVRRIGHRIHTSTAIPLLDRSSPHGIPALSATRTLITLAGTHPAEQVTAALDGAIRDGLTTEDFLHRRIAELRTSGRRGIRSILEIIEGVEVTRGGQSWLEREFLKLLAAAGVERPDSQQVLGRRGDRLIRVDFRFPGTSLVVEVLGYRYHRTPSQLIGDAERMNRLQLNGFHVLQFTYHHVVSDGPAVVRTVQEALAVRRAA